MSPSSRTARNFSRHARGHPVRPADDYLRELSWHEGRIAHAFAEALTERAHAGVDVHMLQDRFGCGTLRSGAMKKPARLRGGGGNLRAFWYQPHQFPHPPQAACGGWPAWDSSRRPHCGRVGWRRRNARPLAGHALQGRGAGRGADAESLSSTTGCRPGRRCCTGEIFPGARGGRPTQMPDLHELGG